MDMAHEKSQVKVKDKVPVWRNVKELFRISWEVDKRYIYRCLLKAIAEVALPFSTSAAVSLLVATAAQPESGNGTLLSFLLLLSVYYFARTGTTTLENQVFTDGTNFRLPLMEDTLVTLSEMDYQEMDTASHRARFNEVMEIMDGGNTSVVQSFLPTVAGFCTNLLGILLYGTVIGSLHPLLIVIILLFSVVNYLYSLKTNQIEKEAQEQAAPYSRKISYMTERTGDFRAVKDVRLYHMENWFTERFQSLYEGMFRIRSKVYRRKFSASTLSAFLSVLRDSLAYFILIKMILSGNLNPATFVLFFSMVATLSSWLDSFLASISDFQRIGLQLQPYMEFMEGQEEQKKSSQEPLSSYYKDTDSASAYSVEFVEATFTYPGQTVPTIDRLDLKIRPGEKISLVGSNGAGKTTLIKLLCGLYRPDSGRVLVNGEDLYLLPEEERFSLFSAVFQDYYELPYSIEETIRRGQPEKNISYQEVLVKSGMDQECRKLPFGDQTKLVRKVNPDAIDLSGGQKQKLQLARALYKDGPILILDEPTAALDPIAESQVYQQYHDMTAGKTAIFISHRLSSALFCDRIIFMENGRVKEEGSHQELMNKKGSYWEMYQIQSQYYQENYQVEGGNVNE